MAGILDFLTSDKFANFIGATGSALSSLADGRPVNIHPWLQRDDMQRQQAQMRGALQAIQPYAAQSMTPQQMGALGALGKADPRGALGYAANAVFPPPQGVTDQQRIFGMLPPDQRQRAAMVAAGLAPRAQAPRPMSVSPGATLVDPATGREVYSAPSVPSSDPSRGLIASGGRVYDATAPRNPDGTLKVVGTAPQTGMPFTHFETSDGYLRFDKRDGTVTPLNKVGAPIGAPAPAPPEMVNSVQSGTSPIRSPGADPDLQRQLTAARESGKDEGQAPQRYRAARSAMNQLEEKHGIVSEKIDGAIEQSGFWSTGLMGQLFQNVGGTDARNLRGLLDTIRANIGFDELSSMREASPTGGALGQVTERELAFLQSVWGDIEQSQSREQLVSNLKRLKTGLAESKARREKAFETDFPELGDSSPQAPQAPQAPQVPQAPQAPIDFRSMTDEQLEQYIRENGG